MTAPTRRAADVPAGGEKGKQLRPAATPWADIDALVGDPATRVVVCCGAGGVGKTTTSAAIAVRAAELGRRVVVLTIDPARRLAQSMDIDELDNIPRRVKGLDPDSGGELFAMMLDMKRTFDEMVEAHTTPQRAEEIFANPFYQSLSSSFSGTQEYMAMEKLSQLVAADEWDLIVVDTPPSRSALDFLDAPERMARFLDGRVLKVLLAPARSGGRAYLKVVTAGMSMFTRILTKVIGSQSLQDISAFVGALDTMFGGFRTRAKSTYDLLRRPGTAFLVVATPANDALREASYFVERLVSEEMPLAGVVLNRVHRSGALQLSAERSRSAAEDVWPLGDDGVAPAPPTPSVASEQNAPAIAAAALRIHADRVDTLRREQRLAGRFAAAHPGVAMAEVAVLPADAHDLDDLREIGRLLAGSR